MIPLDSRLTLNNKNITIFTDGACTGNGKAGAVGGWAFVFEHNGEWIGNSGKDVNTTNQQMELMAAIKACQAMKCAGAEVITIMTDSAYLCNCCNQNWYDNWERNGWINSKREPVANKELWQQLIPFFRNPDYFFIKVQGHTGNIGNEIADKAAVEAARR